MDPKNFGAIVAALRKKSGLTQAALGRKLQVSDKAVSKWETGLGYPEITLLPKIAEVFGITVDYLITGECRSTAVDLFSENAAGNMDSPQEALQMIKQCPSEDV